MSLHKLETGPKYALIAEITVSLPLQCLGLGLLLTKSLKRPSDLMLIFMSTTEFLLIIFSLTSFQNIQILTRLPLDLSIAVGVAYILNFTMIVITLDRALAVKFPLRYRVIVTKRRTLNSFILIMFLGLLICISFYCMTPRVLVLTTVCLNFFVSFVLMSNYIYIIIQVRRIKAILTNHSVGASTKFRYLVPMAIGFTYICFHLIPSFMRVAGLNLGDWTLVIWNLNFICDPLIYTLGSKKTRSHLHRLLCKKKSHIKSKNNIFCKTNHYSMETFKSTVLCVGYTKNKEFLK